MQLNTGKNLVGINLDDIGLRALKTATDLRRCSQALLIRMALEDYITRHYPQVAEQYDKEQYDQEIANS